MQRESLVFELEKNICSRKSEQRAKKLNEIEAYIQRFGDIKKKRD